MRTTLTIDDDVLALARAVAQARKVSVGNALSDLARRGHHASISTRQVGGFVVFDVPGSVPRIDPERVRQAEADEDEARARDAQG